MEFCREEGAVMCVAMCEICGNEVETGRSQCPYCQAECTGTRPRVDGLLHQTINLERGMPLVQQALNRLEMAIKTGSTEGFKVLTFIHGYGSSGAGGAIKTAVLRQLHFSAIKAGSRRSFPARSLKADRVVAASCSANSLF